MSLTSDKLKTLNNDRHRIIRQFDRKEIDEETYEKQISDNATAREAEIKRLMEQDKESCINDIEKHKPEVDFMPKEEVKKDTPKRGKAQRADSYTTHIIESLKKKSLKNVDAVVDKVDELKPGRDKAKIKGQVKSIIRLVKKQSPDRWTKYSWDEDNFLLTEKE